MNNCPNCGAKLTENKKFCGQCGTPHQINDVPEKIIYEGQSRSMWTFRILSAGIAVFIGLNLVLKKVEGYNIYVDVREQNLYVGYSFIFIGVVGILISIICDPKIVKKSKIADKSAIIIILTAEIAVVLGIFIGKNTNIPLSYFRIGFILGGILFGIFGLIHGIIKLAKTVN